MSHGSDTLTGTHNITSSVSPSAVRDPNVIKQHTPNGVISAVSAGPSAGDLTEERTTLESVVHTEDAVCRTFRVYASTQPGELAEGTRKTPFLSHLRARCWWACPLFECQWSRVDVQRTTIESSQILSTPPAHLLSCSSNPFSQPCSSALLASLRE